MSRGGSYGGGKSSLSYLFEPADETNQNLTNSTAKQAQKSQAKKHEKTTDETNQTSAVVSKPGEKPQSPKEKSKTKIAEEGKPQKHTGSQNVVHFYAVSISEHCTKQKDSRSSNSFQVVVDRK